MKITIIDDRRLGIAIQRYDSRYFNPTTTGWEVPFDPAKHIIPFKVVDQANPLFAATIAADIGEVLLDCPDAAALILQLDHNTGIPTAVVDVWALPYPVRGKAVGGLYYV